MISREGAKTRRSAGASPLSLEASSVGSENLLAPVVGPRAVRWLERYLVEVRPRLCLDTRQSACFLTGYGGPFNPDVLSRKLRDWLGALPGAPRY